MAILMYHHIAKFPDGFPENHRGLWVPPDEFCDQVRYLRKAGYTSVTLTEILDAVEGRSRLPRRWVCFTFDDGRRDNLTAAAPILETHGFSLTVFAVSRWTREGNPLGEPEECMSAAELCELRDRGHAVESHTATHPKLSSLSSEDALNELRESRNTLAEILGRAPDWLAYPYGSFAPRIAKLAEEAGYRGAVATIRDNRVRAEQKWWFPRVMVQPGTSPRRLSYMLSPLYHWIHAYKNRRRWVSIR